MYRKMVLSLVITLLFSGNGSGDEKQPTKGLSSEALYRQGRYEEAVTAFQQELKTQPESTHLHTNLGCSLAQLGRNDEAMKEFQAALKTGPPAVQAGRVHYNLGNLHFRKNQRAQAIAEYKTALRLNPQDLMAKYNLEIALRENPPPPPNSGKSPKPNESGGGGDDPKPDQNAPPKENQGQQGPKPQMSQAEAEQILNALRQKEQNPQSRGNLDKSSSTTPIKRDW